MAKINVVTRGNRERPTLVLVHALGTDHRFWDEAVADLSRDHFCVTPDLQGAGATPVPPTPVSAEEHAADLAEAMASLGLERLVLAGCAIGGMVAAICAAQNPGLVSGLVITNPGVRNTDEVKTALRARVGEVRRHGMQVLLPAAPERSFHGMPRDERFERFVERYAAQDSEGYAMSVLGFLGVDIAPYLPRLRCPVLLIPGGKDVLMAADGANEISGRVERAETVLFEDAAHFVPFQAPERFAREMRRFVAEAAEW